MYLKQLMILILMNKEWNIQWLLIFNLKVLNSKKNYNHLLIQILIIVY